MVSTFTFAPAAAGFAAALAAGFAADLAAGFAADFFTAALAIGFLLQRISEPAVTIARGLKKYKALKALKTGFKHRSRCFEGLFSRVFDTSVLWKHLASVRISAWMHALICQKPH
jgi:hypothetical protein